MNDEKATTTTTGFGARGANAPPQEKGGKSPPTLPGTIPKGRPPNGRSATARGGPKGAPRGEPQGAPSRADRRGGGRERER